MNSEDIPQNIRSFIAEHVQSVVELELLLLFQGQPTRAWTAEELCRELRINEQWAQQQIADLARRGLIHIDQDAPLRCRYAVLEPTMAQTVADLAHAYANRRVGLIQLIYAKPSDPVQSFAEAFRLRKGKPNG